MDEIDREWKSLLNALWWPKWEGNLKMNEYICVAAAKSFQSCPTLCDPVDGSPPGSPVPGILQARTLEWVAISFSNAWKWKVKSESEVTQSCPNLSNPMDCSLPGSSVHGILQARLLQWGAIAFSDICVCVCVYIYIYNMYILYYTYILYIIIYIYIYIYIWLIHFAA